MDLKIQPPASAAVRRPLVPAAILQWRLANQHLLHQELDDPAQLVAHLGAVQAQDYPAAKWALALRLRNSTDALLEVACAEGRILRTHVLRPTWHFVAPADVRWMLALTAPRIKAAMTPRTRALGLDEALLARCAAVIVRALDRGDSLTRSELGAALRQAGIVIGDAAAIGHVLSRAELDALVCSGRPRGRHQTYALLDARAPSAPVFSSEEALAELTWRYFNSHGPALPADCAWWSGLPIGAIKRGLELNSWRLDRETIDPRAYWFRPDSLPRRRSDAAYLLPNFDEYTVAYRERDLFYNRARNWTGDPGQDVPFNNVILLNGCVAGRWKRTQRPKDLRIEFRWSIEPSAEQRRAAAAAAQRYAVFAGSPDIEMIESSLPV